MSQSTPPDVYDANTAPPIIITAPLSQHQTHLLLAKLEGLLPYTIPLTRRIQFHLRHLTLTAQVVLSICAPQPKYDEIGIGGTPEDIDVYAHIDAWLAKSAEKLREEIETGRCPWIAAHVDMAFAGQTQAWVFGSWEIPPSSSAGTANAAVVQQQPQRNVHVEVLHSFFHYVYAHLCPALPAEAPESWLWLRDHGKYLSQPYSPFKVLLGSLHEAVRKLIRDQAVARIDARYDKWIFPQGQFQSSGRDGGGEEKGKTLLPEGYSIGTLEESELQKVLEGSPIPRTMAYLKEVVNVGVYHQPVSSTNHVEGVTGDVGGGMKTWKRELIAYGFLNKDGSLGGIMVDPAHRGNGLAAELSKELFERQGATFTRPSHSNASEGAGVGREAKEGWFSHSDVSEDNKESRRVMEKLGGKMMWRVCWVEVDLDVLVGRKENV